MKHDLVGNASVNGFIPNCSTIPYALSYPASVVVLAAQTTQHYSKIAMDSSTPVDRGSEEETFTALTADFGFHDKVGALFLKSPMENLEDFRYYFADEDEIDAFVTAIWKPETTTPLEPEEEPEEAPEKTLNYAAKTQPCKMYQHLHDSRRRQPSGRSGKLAFGPEEERRQQGQHCKDDGASSYKPQDDDSEPAPITWL